MVVLSYRGGKKNMALRFGKITPLFFVMLAVLLFGLNGLLNLNLPVWLVPAMFIIGGLWFIVDWLGFRK